MTATDEWVVLTSSRARRTLDLLDELVAAGLFTRADAAAVVHRIRTATPCDPQLAERDAAG